MISQVTGIGSFLFLDGGTSHWYPMGLTAKARRCPYRAKARNRSIVWIKSILGGLSDQGFAGDTLSVKGHPIFFPLHSAQP